MASGSTARWRTCSCQASAEHFQHCAEFPPLRNRALGPLAVTVLHIYAYMQSLPGPQQAKDIAILND
jgi:hypothetical protein